jgi:hypothetical protein
MTQLQKLIGAAMAAPTAAARLAAFCRIDGAGLPGVAALRLRQERVRKRLMAATRPQEPAEAPRWVPRTRRFPQAVRDACRAHESGDTRRGLLLAYSYHRHITPLFASSRAEIVWGRAPVPVTDWHAYSKSYGRPANYVNAAYEVGYTAGEPVVILHSARGKTLQVPLVPGADYSHPSLLDGDLYAIEKRPGIVLRYSLKDGITGYAVHYPTTQGLEAYWEHGATLDECRRERERKLALARVAQIQGRAARKARLIARLCGALTCTVDDARAVGYCRAGIDAFCARYGLLGGAATVTQLRATQDAQVARVIEQAARRVATQEARG